MSAEESQELVSAGSRGLGQPLRPTGALHAHNVQVNGGSLTFANGDVHNHTHIHKTPQPEAVKVDLVSALESIDNHRRIQQDTFSKATPKTGEWIFEYDVFPIWRDPKSDVKMMWGSGMPGAGKTILTSVIIDGVEKSAEEQDPSICVCYIYIRYSNSANLTVRQCLEVLVKQTVEKHHDCLELAEDVYAKHIRLKTRPTEEELFQLLRGFATMLKVVYFLEALDEAPPEVQINLIERLLSTNAKLFVTSRPLKTLEERFPNAHHFPIIAQESDLDLHIESKLDSSPELSKVLEQGGESLRADIVTSVKQKCGGMFLHASLQLTALQRCTTIHEVKETLASFPPRIEDVYRDTWMRIVPQASQRGVRAQNCIIWVLNAPKSMTVVELQQAAAVCLDTHKFDPDRIVHIDTIVTLCRGLLVVDEETTLVRLVHYTAKETLERLILETFPHLHSLMAALCISRLIQHGFQDWNLDDDQNTFERVMKADPLLPYAYYAWSRHGQNSLSDPLVVTKVKEFVRGCRSFPLEQGYHKLELLGPLHVAAFFNLPLSLTDNILDPNCRTKRQFTPLHLACMDASHFNTLQELLSLPLIDVNAVNKWKETPLICAASSGNVGAVKLLLAHPEIRLDLKNTAELTAFTRAVINGHDVVVQAILAHSPAEIHLTSSGGRTAISLAAEKGHFTMVKLLLNHSQLEVRVADDNGRTPLSWAASSSSIDTFKHILCLAWDDLHLADNGGRTPLSWAAGLSSCIEIFKYLISLAQDDLDLTEKDGFTPLSWALFGGAEEAVKILLACPGTNINQVDNTGYTPVVWASARKELQATLKVLLANPGTDINLAVSGGLTALICSTVFNAPDNLKIILAHPQLNVNLPDNKGRTALSRAAQCSRKEVELLLAHPDIKVNLPDGEGRAPLIWATMEKNVSSDAEDVVQALLAHPQTNVNHADNEGRTALSWASQQGHERIVKLLLEHPQIGPSHQPDNQGRTPLIWASKERHNGIVELLLAHLPIQRECERDRGLISMLYSAIPMVCRLWRR